MARITITAARARLAVLNPFDAGSVRGEPLGVLSSPPETGQLPPVLADRLTSAQWERKAWYMCSDGPDARTLVPDAPVYVVYSYATPIAWVQIDGTAVIPDIRYSVTTSRHQAMVRAAWAETDFTAHTRAMA